MSVVRLSSQFNIIRMLELAKSINEGEITMSKELKVIETLEVVPFFTKGKDLDDTLDKIEKEALAHVPDVTTLKGRNAIKANITLVTQSKTYLEKEGKKLADEYKLIPKVIDSTRKTVKERLVEVIAKCRLKLNEWEAEQAAIKLAKAEQEAAEALAKQVELDHEMGLLLDAEFDRKVELDRLAAIEAQRLHDEEIAREATARAEEAAKAEIKAKELAVWEAEQRLVDAEVKRVADLAEAAKREERQRQAAIQAETELKQAEELRIEREKQLAIEAQERLNQTIIDKLEQDRIAKYNADKAAEQARLDEVARAKAEQDRQDEILATRKANTELKTKIKTAQKEAIIALGASSELAIEIVKGMHKGSIPHMQVIY